MSKIEAGEHQPKLSDLFDPVPPVWEDELLSCYLLPDTSHIDVRPKLRESIAEIGVQHPILVGQSGSDLFVIDGLHRLAACRAADVREIPARVSKVDDIGSSALTLISNGQRRANEIAEFDAIMKLVRAGHDEQTIARLTGIAVGTIRKRSKIRMLISQLGERFRAGEMSAPAAEAAAALPTERQLALYRATAHLPKIRHKDVMEARLLQQQEAAANLPDDMFDDDGDDGHDRPDPKPRPGNERSYDYRADAEAICTAIERFQEMEHPTKDDIDDILNEIEQYARTIAGHIRFEG